MTHFERLPEDFIAAYEAALASQDWEQVAPLIHDDCVAVFTESTFRGKAAVEGAFRKTFDLIQDETYTISNVFVVHTAARPDRFSANSDSPTCQVYVFGYDFAWSGIINGQPSSGGGRGTSVLVHENGRWLLRYEHLGPPSRGGG